MVIPSTSTDHSGNRAFCGLVYESGRTQFLMTGGRDITKASIIPNAASIDTWTSATGASWALSSPTASPTHRYLHAMAYSADDGYSFIHGGLDSVGVKFDGQLWYYNGTTWGQFATAFVLGTNAPTARFGHTMVSADGYSRLLMVGGIGTDLINHMTVLPDSWMFSTTTKSWTQISSTNNPPSRVYGGSGFDGYNMLVFGGAGTGNGTLYNDVWKLNALSLQWSAVATTGTAPSARKGAAVCFDLHNNRLMIYGGYSISGGLSNETFVCSSAGVWSQISTPFHPLRKWGGTMAFDSATNTVVLFGGTLLDGSPDGSVFTFDCVAGTWSGAGDFSSSAANGPVSDH